MFYSQVILARKGPLGKIWLAAHFDKKLSKNQIFSTDISTSVQTVLNPSTPLALRVSGHLMLGIVRIYSKKVKYLMIDCTEAMWKMKLAFKPGRVDIDPNFLSINIDDHKHYGNISVDFEFPILDNIGFASQLLPLDVGRGYTQDEYSVQSYRELIDDSASFKNFDQMPRKAARTSEIELVRGEASRSSISAGPRTPLSVDGRRSSITHGKFEDDLPAFDGDEFISYGSPHMEAMIPTFEYQQEYPDFQPVEHEQLQSSIHPTNVVAHDNVLSEAAAVSAPKLMVKKGRVHIDERVELSDKVYKQRLNEVAPILRRKADEPLPFRKPICASKIGSTEFSLIDEEEGLCPELRFVYESLFASDLPFPSKRSKTEITHQPPIEMVRGAEQEHNEILGVNISRQHDELTNSVNMGKDYSQEYDQMPEVSFNSDQGRFSEGLGAKPEVIGSEHLRQEMLQVLLKPQTLSEQVDAKQVQSSERTQEFLNVLNQEFKESDKISFEGLCNRVSRNIAARCFLEVLQLKSWGAIDVHQSSPFSDIVISPSQ